MKAAAKVFFFFFILNRKSSGRVLFLSQSIHVIKRLTQRRCHILYVHEREAANSLYMWPAASSYWGVCLPFRMTERRAQRLRPTLTTPLYLQHRDWLPIQGLSSAYKGTRRTHVPDYTRTAVFRPIGPIALLRYLVPSEPPRCSGKSLLSLPYE